MTEMILTNNWNVEGMQSIDTAMKNGAYASLNKVLKMDPDAVIEEVKRANWAVGDKFLSQK